MANISVEWEVEGIISPEESVRGLIPVIESKGPEHSGTFWTWDGRVSFDLFFSFFHRAVLWVMVADLLL